MYFMYVYTRGRPVLSLPLLEPIFIIFQIIEISGGFFYHIADNIINII